MFRIVRLSFSLLAGLAFVSTGASAKDLAIGLAAAHTGMDPHWHSHGQNNSAASHVFEPLIGLDAGGRLEARLAVSWKALSDTSFEVKLRKGVKFHDGSPFTAKDVLFSFDRVIKGVPNSPGSFVGYTKGVTDIKATDDHTVVFTTGKAIPLLAKNISRIFIISEKNGSGAATKDYTTGKAMIGTGAYKFVKWVPGASVEYARNPDYWGGQEPWEKVTFKVMKNDASRLAALLAGDVDVIAGVPTTDIVRLKTDKRLKTWTGSTTRFTMFVPGFAQDPDKTEHFTNKDGSKMAKNPFRDIRVREALNLAIDRKIIHERVNQGQAVIARQFIPETMFGFVPGYDMSGYDLDKAKKLMAEAGYADGFKLTIHTSNDRIVNAVKTIQVVGQMWSKLNLDITVDTMPHSVFSKRRGKIELPMYMSSWGNSLGDPMGVLNPNLQTYDKKKRRGRANRGRYSNKAFDAVVDLAAVEVDTKKREALYQKALKMAMDDFAMLPIVFWVYSWGTSPELKYIPRLDQYTLATAVRPAK